MKSIIQHFNELKQSDWDYYFEISIHQSNISNPFIEYQLLDSNFREFVDKYFGKSGKRELIDDFNMFSDITNERLIHSTSVFFLGILFYKKTTLNEILYKNSKTRRGYEIFPFIWFLSILFHDYAMEIEEKESEKKFFHIIDIDGLKKELKIENDLLLLNNSKVNLQLFKSVKKYFNYRLDNDNTIVSDKKRKIDHGILAGIFLYDRLVQIRRKKAKDSNSNLNWNKSLEKIYAEAGLAICFHNMWIIDSKDKYFEYYKRHNLNSLITPEFNKISIKNHPLLLLFGLIDSIEPIKVFTNNKQNHDVKYILENILIEFDKKIIKIKNKEDSKLLFDNFIKALKGTILWLDLSLIIVSPNEIIISLDNKFKTYKKIQEEYYLEHHKTIKTCWIADCKRKLGINIKTASNRVESDSIKYPCPNEEIFERIKKIIIN